VTLARFYDLALPAGLALLVGWSTLHAGLPELRHDWRYSAAGDAIGATLAGFSSGWLPQGLGVAQPYPTLYLIGFVLWPLTAFHNATVIVAAIVGAGTFTAARAAMKIGAQAGGSAVTCITLGIFAVANPWVYSEMVAGHIEMVLAYALLLALVAEISRAKPRTIALLLLAAYSVTQIEFFAIAFVPLVVWCVSARRYEVLLVLLTATAPIALGIIASYDALRSIPYILPWQAAASIPLDRGSVLLGSEFGYAKPFEPYLISLATLGVFAACGVRYVRDKPVERVIIGIAIAALFFASGTRGPIAPFYAWCVLHVPESGLFRELYDLTAIVAIAYVVSIARVPVASPVLRIVALGAAGTLCVPWVVKPVAASTVAAASIPVAPVASTPQTRVALFPAFQPLSFGGHGSGFDPDAYVRAGKAYPLNEFYPTFPVDAALSTAERTGDTGALAALGVTQVIVRPYFASRWDALKYQLIAAGRRPGASGLRSRTLAARPLLSLGRGMPAVVSIGNDPAESATFFGDLDGRERKRFGLPAATRLVRYDPSRASLDPHAGWVDARLAVVSRPRWGNAFGGVVTASDAPLDTKDAVAVLAQSSGALVTPGGAIVAPARPALHWWRLPRAGTPLRCRGTCIVVMGTTQLPTLPEHAAPSSYEAVEANAVFPWLVVAKLPSGGTGTLRYAVRYHRHWVAVQRGRILQHVRLATALNGWLVDGEGGGTIYLVESLALIQALLEVLCIATLAALVVSATLRRRNVAARSLAG